MRQETFIHTQKADLKYNYLVFFPNKYKESTKEKWPLIVFLHGAFERGDNPDILKREALPKFASKKEFPFVIVAPQCPENSHWIAENVMQVTNKIISNYSIDKARIYLTGLSMGGFATWQIASRFPDKFAAIIPICGGGNPGYVHKLVNLPIWAFHGEKDRVIPLRQSIDMVNAVNEKGGNAILTVYPHAYHDSWTETYENKNIYEWLLQHTIET